MIELGLSSALRADSLLCILNLKSKRSESGGSGEKRCARVGVREHEDIFFGEV